MKKMILIILFVAELSSWATRSYMIRTAEPDTSCRITWQGETHEYKQSKRLRASVGTALPAPMRQGTKGEKTMTNRELSQAIRKDLKEHGITSKDVSVRVRDALYDTSVNITIKNPIIRETDVESITMKYSKVDYDQRSMEILAGCNIYVHCEYAYGLFDDVSAPLIPIAEKVFNNEKYNGRKIAENEEVEIHMIKINEAESRLYEFKKSDKHHSAINGYIIRSPKSLAIAMWRFKNLHTIYA